MTLLRRGAIILGLASPDQNWRVWTGGSLITNLSDKRSRQKTVTVYHEHITKKLNPKAINTDWFHFSIPSDQELADNGIAIQDQMKYLAQNGSDEPIMQEIEQSDDGVLGLYLGKWFHNPARDVQSENRVLLVLVSDRLGWIPVIE